MKKNGPSSTKLTCVDQNDVVREKITQRHTLSLFERSYDSFAIPKTYKRIYAQRLRLFCSVTVALGIRTI